MDAIIEFVAELFDNLSIWDKVQAWLYEKIPFTPLRWMIAVLLWLAAVSIVVTFVYGVYWLIKSRF